MRTVLTLLIVVMVASSHLPAADILVTNTNDTGEGSLRVALHAANNNQGPDTIVFIIPQTDSNYDSANGYWTINVQSILPTVADDSLIIDGFSQHVMNPDAPPDMPLVVIMGGMTQESHGLLLWGAYNSVNQLCIGGFHGPQILIKGQYSHHNSIEGCFVGLYPDGQTGMGDAENSERGVEFSKGIMVSSSAFDNRIGGAESYMRNIVCNMYAEGILIEQSNGNVVQGNYIGVAKDGQTAAGNGWIDVARYNNDERIISRYPGVSLQAASSSNVIGGSNASERNLICASGRAGIRIEGDGTADNSVKGNYLGVGADGKSHTNLGNAEVGLKIMRGAQRNTIGADSDGEGNVIAGNGSSGVQIRENVSDNIIAGNLIGVAADGVTRAANAHNGIYLFGQKDSGFPENNQIGPGNVIIVNGEETADAAYAVTWAAIRMDSSGTSFNRVFGNWLGVDKIGLLGSDYNSGVIIGSGAHDNKIGPDNIIARTQKYGVWIRQVGSNRNSITENSFEDNARQHIFLSDSANASMLAPQNLFVDAAGVTGTSTPLSKVELYIDDGKTFVDSVMTDDNGDFGWNGQTNDAVFLATATDAAGNTSEFSSSAGVPVELSSFIARSVSNGVLLSWRTESESNNLGFYLEKSSPEFREIAFIRGQGTSVLQHSYSYLDETPLTNESSYRLRQVDFDGTTTFSDEISVAMTIPENASLHPPFPNPFNGETVFLLNLQEDAEVVVNVFNLRGERIVTLLRGRLTAGFHRLVWDGRDNSHLSAASGLYIIRAEIGGAALFQQKVMFVR
jgi:hypothetical protein